MAPQQRRVPLAYTFGNHQHWVDLQWLWGYHVLPGSIRDMLRLCEETGARGNVNFDGVGYEKLAAEAPEALQQLRKAVQQGKIEAVGCSYGQPYGLFHGGESNVRQRIFGVRSTVRLLGVRPRTFWEEEFDFFPQLPQILAGCGFTGASLFFQWTWHTPEVPVETEPIVMWESPDGTALPTATRNSLNLHQWPEDMQILLDQLAQSPEGRDNALVLQWLELMPSPDWMCRTELIAPQLKALASDERFELRFLTLGAYLKEPRHESDGSTKAFPARAYRLDDTFHGMTLGKNGDRLRQTSHRVEHSILAAESVSVVAGMLGRPYPSWNVYPTWELEEAWREMLQAQHHDIDECEGLCGHIGKFSYVKAESISQEIRHRTLGSIASRVPKGELFLNPFGWPIQLWSYRPEPLERGVAVHGTRHEKLPPFGYRVHDENVHLEPSQTWKVHRARGSANVECGTMTARFDEIRGKLSELTLDGVCLSKGILDLGFGVGKNRTPILDPSLDYETGLEPSGMHSLPGARFAGPDGDHIVTILAPPFDAAIDRPALRVEIVGQVASLKPGMMQGLTIGFDFELEHAVVYRDYPYGIEATKPYMRPRKKYPSGDWMTSPQWFEDVHDSFTSLSFVDVVGLDPDGKERGLMIVHDSHQQWFLQGNRLENLVHCYDPWDERLVESTFRARYAVIPHAGLTHAERIRMARTALPWEVDRMHSDGETSAPSQFAPVWCEDDHVTLSAIYRESMEAGQGLNGYPNWQSDPDRWGETFPTVVRVVEWNGRDKPVTLMFPGNVLRAAKTNLMGEVLEWLETHTCKGPVDIGIPWTSIQLPIKPREIVTVMVDLELARKKSRNLDAHRSVWATIHRTSQDEDVSV